MKKIVLISLTLFTILSCSSDDEGDSFDPSQIEGIWEFNDTTYYLSNGSVVEDIFAFTCGEQSVIRINANGTIESVEFLNDNCVNSSENYPYFKWEYIGNGTLRFSRRNTSDESILFIRFDVSFPTANTMKWFIAAPGIINGENYESSEYNLTKR